jgi:two-component system, NtrC family, sensor kinase
VGAKRRGSRQSQRPRNTPRSGPAPVADATNSEVRYFRQLEALGRQLKQGRDVFKVTRAALRAGLELLSASEGCVALLTPSKPQIDLPFSVPRDANFDRDLLTSFIRGGEDPIPPNLALGRIRRRGRMWGVLAVRAPTGAFTWRHRDSLSAIAALANEALDRIDEERIREVRARIDYKIMEQLRPKDLFYQVLHGLHSLTQYDHSASLWIYNPGAELLEVVAETITWKKGKSDKIGLKLPLGQPLLALLAPGVAYGFDRPAEAWEEWTTGSAVGLAELLDINSSDAGSGNVPLDRSMLCAPLATRDRVLGLLKVASKHSGWFGAYEAELVAQFLPHASIALQNSQRTQSLEQNLIQAERKHAMADLARGVAHDVNNALGAVLPLVQQIRAELAEGSIDASAISGDLREIERSIQICRRIFGGMLSFARGGAQAAAGANIKQAIDNTRAILKQGFARHGIQVVVEMDPELPPIKGAQADLEQLFLNLLSNSRDAMPSGGRLTIRARRLPQGIELLVEDTGCGIPPEHLSMVMEPFFSTKPEGNGLGLSICRSIVWQMQGKLDITSTPGAGTRIMILIPAAAEKTP